MPMVVAFVVFRVTMLAVSAHNKFMLLNFYFCSLRFVNKYMAIWKFSHPTSPTFPDISHNANSQCNKHKQYGNLYHLRNTPLIRYFCFYRIFRPINFLSALWTVIMLYNIKCFPTLSAFERVFVKPVSLWF